MTLAPNLAGLKELEAAIRGSVCQRDNDACSTGARLASIKARYDPGNLFRFNQNIAPA